MKRLTILAALLVAATPAVAQIPTTFTNLQVLPKDIPRSELIATMRNIAGSLGVRCVHCHVGPDDLQGMDFAIDEKRSKVAARAMLQMVRAINADYVSRLPAGRRRHSRSAASPVTAVRSSRHGCFPKCF